MDTGKALSVHLWVRVVRDRTEGSEGMMAHLWYLPRRVCWNERPARELGSLCRHHPEAPRMSCLLFKDELDRGQPLLDIHMSLLTHMSEQKGGGQ